MAHLTARKGYVELEQRLNRFPQGAAPGRLLYEILAMLFSEREAELVARLPVRPFSAAKAASVWSVGRGEAEKILNQLADRALLVDMPQNGTTLYVLPPPMAGFFEFAMMRIRDDIDQKVLSELYEQYISVEDDFMRGLFVGGETQLGRVLVHEDAVSLDTALEVLDTDRSTEIIESATEIGVSLCYCRHKRQHLGKACSAPLDICMTFNVVASSLVRHGFARRIDKVECLELLHQAQEANLAQFGENVQRGVNFICNCCPCCCEAMLAVQRFGLEQPIHTSNYIAEVEEACSGCGRCLPACPVKVLSLEAEGEQGRGRKRAVVDRKLCVGCGVCVRTCQRQAINMVQRQRRVITPVNSTHKAVLMAIERGMLQHLIFDNRALWSHRALAAVFGVVLRLDPIKRLLASEQVGSRYLGALCAKFDY
ncbi:MAG: (Fe-S)-binding protein [Desulfuromonas sp.]|nr:MAG: (Fe-S)-binding protein [Desulfuromonas sp.]